MQVEEKETKQICYFYLRMNSIFATANICILSRKKSLFFSYSIVLEEGNGFGQNQEKGKKGKKAREEVAKQEAARDLNSKSDWLL